MGNTDQYIVLKESQVLNIANKQWEDTYNSPLGSTMIGAASTGISTLSTPAQQ